MIKLGAPPQKLVMGLPLYGRTFLLPDPLLASPKRTPRLGNVARNFGFQGPFTRENGFMGYNEVSTFIFIFSNLNLYMFNQNVPCRKDNSIKSISPISRYALNSKIVQLAGSNTGTMKLELLSL